MIMLVFNSCFTVKTPKGINSPDLDKVQKLCEKVAHSLVESVLTF